MVLALYVGVFWEQISWIELLVRVRCNFIYCKTSNNSCRTTMQKLITIFAVIWMIILRGQERWKVVFPLCAHGSSVCTNKKHIYTDVNWSNWTTHSNPWYLIIAKNGVNRVVNTKFSLIKSTCMIDVPALRNQFRLWYASAWWSFSFSHASWCLHYRRRGYGDSAN